MDINIVGAGPAGSYTAYLLAKKGHSVKIFEKNSQIGKPIQCTGILSDFFPKIMSPKNNFVLTIVKKTRIYSPNEKYIETRIKDNYVICRNKFDNYLADLAKKQGVKYHLNHSFNSFEKKGNKISCKINNKGKTKLFESDVLIGADGPLSQVAKDAGLYDNRKFLIGTQIEAELKNNNIVEFYPFLGSYAWVVPINKNTVRIGVASYKNSKKIFDKFVKEKLGKSYKTIENQSGIIPVFDPKIRAQKDNIYLVGDAATFNKTTSGGGINQSLISAKILAECIDKNKNYQRKWKKKMFNKLYVHMLAHKMMEKFTNKDWEYLIKTFSEPKMKSLLYEENRDNIIKMMLKIIINKPSLIVKYLRYFPFSELKNYR